jgi:hypothetical protein
MTMAEIVAKLFYTAILLSVAGFCLHEAFQAWFDNELQYGTFAATKDGANVESGNAFRRLVVLQQRHLLQLYRTENTAAQPGEFGTPDKYRTLAVDLSAINFDFDVGSIPKSALDELKIEAAGVNVTSLLSTLRRWVRPPNEITGSVDEIGKTVYAAADWPRSPRRAGFGTEPRSFMLSTQSGLEAASFEMAARIFFAHIASSDAVWKDVEENDFCAYSRALASFQEYVNLRNHAATEDEKKIPLEKARVEIDRLIAGKTALVYAYRLGGYIGIERVGAIKPDDTEQIKTVLDQAERRFKEYLTRFSAIDPNARDAGVQEQITSLAARRGQMLANPQVTANSKEFLGAFEKARAGLPVLEASPKPGASIGPDKEKTAGTLCCFVRDAAGKHYLVTVSYVAGKVGTKMVWPAAIDQAESQEIGSVVKISGLVALVELAPGIQPAMGTIAGVASNVALQETLTLRGRTSKSASGKVRGIHTTLNIPNLGGEARLDDAILTEPMSSPGDGGAPVLNASGELVGILVARSNTDSVVLPLQAFLNQEGLSLL